MRTNLVLHTRKLGSDEWHWAVLRITDDGNHILVRTGISESSNKASIEMSETVQNEILFQINQ